MTTVAWPSTLPDYLESWDAEDDESVRWTQIPGGKPKPHGELTAPVKRMSVTMQLKAEQYSVLEAFFREDLQNGANDFLFPNPYKAGAEQKFYMTSPPKVVSTGPITVTASMQWLQLVTTIQSPPLSFSCTATPGDHIITVNWTQSYFADSYQVWVDDAPYGSVLPNTAFELVVTGRTNGQSYSVRVVASNDLSDTSSNELNVIPNPPELPGAFAFSAIAGHLKATIGLAKAVSWTAPGTLPYSYRVKYGTAAGTYPYSVDTDTTTPSATITGLSAVTYYWRPYGVDDVGVETALAAEQSFTPASTGATYYELRQGSALPGTLIATIEPNGFPVADDNLTAEVQRSYWLIAKNPNGSTDATSNPQVVTPRDLAPGDFGFSLMPIGQGVRINLTSTSARALQYQIRQGPSEPGSTVATIGEGEFPYDDEPLTAGVERKYWLSSINDEGTRLSSDNPRTATPLAQGKPSAPAFSATGRTGSIDIALTASATGADRYVLKRGAVEGSAVTVDSDIAEAEFPFPDSGRTNGVTETYWLYAENESGQTAASNNPRTATPSNSFTNPPGAFSFALTPGAGQVSIALSPAAAAADYYNIYAGTWGVLSGDDMWRQIGGNHLPGAFPIVDTGRTNGVAQKYWLSAFNAGGVTQATGNPKTATPTDGKPGQFTFSASIAVAAKVSITLDTPSSGATSYKIKRDTVQIASGVTTWPYDDTSMTLNVSHSYEVLATNAQGDTAASNNPVAVTPWSAGLSYPANTVSWDGADAAKVVLFSGTQAIQEWRSKSSDTVKFDGTSSSAACLLTTSTNSVDASAAPLRTLFSDDVTQAYPLTISFKAWFPSDCPTVCCPLDMGFALGFLFRKSGSSNSITFTSASTTVIYLNNSFTASALENKWHIVTAVIASTTAAVKLRVNGTEVSATPSAAMRSMTGLGINRTTQGIATVGGNIKVARIAIANSALSGTALTDFESILADGEGSGGSGGGGGSSTTITKTHTDALVWVDPREPWSALTTGKYQSQTPGGSYDPSNNAEPGVKAADGVLLMGHVAAPNNANGFAIQHRIRPQNPAADAYWRSGFNVGAADLRYLFRTKYIEGFAFYFPASALTSTQQEADIYEHHTAYVAGQQGMQSAFVVYRRNNNNNPRLDIQWRYSLDGTQAGSVGGLIVSIPLQANKWYFFAHKFVHSADLADAPYNRLWYAVDGGAITKCPEYNGRNAMASPPYGGGGYEHVFVKNELYQYYPWTSGVTECNHFSLGIFGFKDDGHAPSVNESTLIAMMKDIVKIGEASPTTPELDPWTDPRTRMLVDANKTFASHSNIEVITGTTGGYGTNNFAAIPETGLQVDSSARRLIKRVQGWPGVDSSKFYFQAQLDETLPTYSTENTVRASVGRNQYDSDITTNGQGWWYIGDMVVHSSLYSDVYVAGQNGADSYAPYEMSIWGLHHVGDWGGNASYYDSTNLPPLTPFTVFFDPKTTRAGGLLYIRMRSTTHVSGGTWTVGSICQTKAQQDSNGYNRSYTLADNLVDGDVVRVVLYFGLGYQQSQNPFMHAWVQVNNGAISGDLINDTGPLGHYLADTAHQARALGFLYVWATAYHGNVWPWTRSANGIILTGNHGYRSGTRGTWVVKDTTSSGRPIITVDRAFDWLNRP